MTTKPPPEQPRDATLGCPRFDIAAFTRADHMVTCVKGALLLFDKDADLLKDNPLADIDNGAAHMLLDMAEASARDLMTVPSNACATSLNPVQVAVANILLLVPRSDQLARLRPVVEQAHR